MTTSRRDEEFAEYEAIRKEEDDTSARERATELGERTGDPLLRAVTKSEEIRRSRSLGEQQRAVVAGAELLPLVAALGGILSDEDSRVQWALGLIAGGLGTACYSALDVPEVPFAAIDALIEAYARLLADLGYREFAADRIRARRHYVAGDDDRVAAIVEGLMPHVNYTNAYRQRLGCPGCVLSSVAWYLGPEADLVLLEEMLTPVFEGQMNYPNENPGFIRWLRQNRETYCENAQSSHLYLARAHLWRGHVAVAEEHVPHLRHFDLDECFLLPTIFFLELAMASGDAARIRERIDLLRPRVEGHEDVEEGMLGAIRVAQALALLGENEAEQGDLWRFAEACAARLDGRLERPRHLQIVRDERAKGAPFLAAIAAAS
ncbi:MAG: hypothetical protein KC486_08310 [Myxococcales bacterium]|nr:hypothetical protein [Myxococcales bacterium]